MKEENFKIGDTLQLIKSNDFYRKGAECEFIRYDGDYSHVIFEGTCELCIIKTSSLKAVNNGWTPYDENEFNMLSCDGKYLVQFKNGDMEVHHLGSSVSRIDIVTYQVITPYKPPRENIIFKNKAEMLTELISRGKLYINEEGNEHVYFSEDEMYTLGYVAEDGRSDRAEDILDELEFWVE